MKEVNKSLTISFDSDLEVGTLYMELRSLYHKEQKDLGGSIKRMVEKYPNVHDLMFHLLSYIKRGEE